MVTATGATVILDKDLNSAWSLFDPLGHGELVGEDECKRAEEAGDPPQRPWPATRRDR